MPEPYSFEAVRSAVVEAKRLHEETKYAADLILYGANQSEQGREALKKEVARLNGLAKSDRS